MFGIFAKKYQQFDTKLNTYFFVAITMLIVCIVYVEESQVLITSQQAIKIRYCRYNVRGSKFVISGCQFIALSFAVHYLDRLIVNILVFCLSQGGKFVIDRHKIVLCPATTSPLELASFYARTMVCWCARSLPRGNHLSVSLPTGGDKQSGDFGRASRGKQNPRSRALDVFSSNTTRV